MTTRQRSQNITLKITSFTTYFLVHREQFAGSLVPDLLSEIQFFHCTVAHRISLQTAWSRNIASVLCLVSRVLYLVHTLSQNFLEISHFVYWIPIESLLDPYQKKKHFINSWRVHISSDATVKGDLCIHEAETHFTHLWQHFDNLYYVYNTMLSDL